MKPVNDFPSLYHAHHNRSLEDLPFWLNIIKRYSGPILELGCGSGRIFSPLYKAGFDIIGMDNDPAMLAYLQQHWEGKDRPALIQADMTAFHLAPVFRLVILPCNTYSALSPTQRRTTLACVRRCLTGGGAFCVSMPNPHMLKRLPKESAAEVEEVFPHPTDGEPVQVSSAWKQTTDTFTLEWHYDHLLPDGHVERTTACVCHLLEKIDRYLEEFRQAGFDDIKIFGDFDESPYDESSPNLIIMAH
jgi:SAM-dependent methyltransferase